jgi:Mn2+/Fe2+ NRAMP family transporter
MRLPVILLPIALLFLGGIGLVLLLWPSRWLRRQRNPWQPDTPENRLYTRSLGQMVCLFLLLIVSGFGSGATAEGFHRNILVALWISFLFVPVLVWILWRTSPLRRVARRLLTGELDEEKWELRMSLAFSGLLTSMIITAFLLALNGYYPGKR